MRGRLASATIAAFVVGSVVMLLFEGLLARLVGVLSLAAFIVCGLFLIADPEYLREDGRDEG